MTGNDRPEGPVLLDGSEGDGGGVLLRSALSLSLVTGRPFRLTHFREREDAPGLRPAHLACVRGAEALAPSSTSEGAEVGATELTFTPGPVRAGDYLLDAGAVGTPLLFQCLFLPLALAGGGSLTLRGATHLAQGPSYPYLVGVWQPALQAYGLRAGFRLIGAGFSPEGAGEFRARVEPPHEPPRLVELPARGTLHDIAVSSSVGGLPFAFAERQSRAAEAALRERGLYCHVENRPLPATRSAGSVTFILAQFEYTLAGFTVVGERARPPEDVGREAAEAVTRFMETGGALDEHLAEQLVLPAALLAAGRLGASTPGTTRFTTARVTGHLRAQARAAETFLRVRISADAGGSVEIRPA
ncbi:RNA 3'-terminal phosphate cyclase [Myxococcaceae bacterium GXIMD 01537]